MRSSFFIHFLVSFVAVNALSAHPRSTVNGPCTGKDGRAGVCISKSSCDGAGESWVNNACPGTPEDIKCCTKPSCQQAGRSGDCRWQDKCGADSETLTGLCPGPSAFKCCVPKDDKPGNDGDLGQKILKKAKEAEGTPYHWGGGSCKGATGGGYDCSGLVSWAVCQVTGRDLFSEGLRVTRSMYCASESKLKYKKVKFADRRAGDAVFFGGACDCKSNPKGIHHVGLMMDSKYNMWNAFKTGTNVRKDNFENWDEKACPYVIRFE
ncbi:hypothetical protein BU25DRAFT_487236 [Macroventuria anomochaeta]|uniref:Uncharacterized protein n=1 Tax=Macroventuria anomochaeta TaxID=301207 RepID=A0ACB6SHQ5_9PLEO|nr:uncharacterized protein BU25DRAFT_487236 [Macroventuria anomochaeta]KAF2632819.1 hypothetical protein BU25DRAFT_487236 [Macroventuria anomochaeta]